MKLLLVLFMTVHQLFCHSDVKKESVYTNDIEDEPIIKNAKTNDESYVETSVDEDEEETIEELHETHYEGAIEGFDFGDEGDIIIQNGEIYDDTDIASYFTKDKNKINKENDDVYIESSVDQDVDDNIKKKDGINIESSVDQDEYEIIKGNDDTDFESSVDLDVEVIMKRNDETHDETGSVSSVVKKGNENVWAEKSASIENGFKGVAVEHEIRGRVKRKITEADYIRNKSKNVTDLNINTETLYEEDESEDEGVVQDKFFFMRKYVTRYDQFFVLRKYSGLDVYFDRKLSGRKIIIGELFSYEITNTSCYLTIKVICSFRAKHPEITTFPCSPLITARLPPRMNLVFFIFKSAVVEVMAAELIIHRLFSKCTFQRIFAKKRTRQCELLLNNYVSSARCSRSLTRYRKIKHWSVKGTDLNSICFLCLLIYGFISMAIFQLQLLRQRRIYV